MDTIETMLERLAAAQGDLHAQAALTAEFMLLNQPETQREPLRAALDAAAVLRWFDAGLLSKVLDITGAEAEQHFAALQNLPFVETYRGGNDGLYNIHESTRLGWRKKLAQTQLQRFRTLSLNAAACFAADYSAGGRIEWIYHLLCGAPENGASELEKLDRAWSGQALPEDYYTLASTLKELQETELLSGRALCWTTLFLAWARHIRGETAALKRTAEAALQLAREYKDNTAEAEARCLLGDALRAQGRLDAALVAYDEYLQISQRLAELDSGNAGWQRDLAVAHARQGDVFRAQNRLDAALTAYSEYFRISRRLAELDPGNAGWQRELAVAHSRQGDVLCAQDQLDAALVAYGENLRIFRRLAELNPGNAGWQRELAVAHGKQGDVFRAQNHLDAALTAYSECLRISRRLAELDPGNAGWQRDLAVAHGRQGDVLCAQDQLDAALVAYGENLRISRRLAELDPGNAGWQSDLAMAHNRQGNVLHAQRRLDAALVAYGENLRIFRRLAELDPGNAGWQHDLAVALASIGIVCREKREIERARDALNESANILLRLTELDPSSAVWLQDLATVHSWLEELHS